MNTVIPPQSARQAALRKLHAEAALERFPPEHLDGSPSGRRRGKTPRRKATKEQREN